MAISAESYKRIGQATAAAVSIVAAYGQDAAQTVGLTVSSFVTLSFEPPLVMFAVQHNADSYRSLTESKMFGVSLLSAGQAEVAERFARKGPAKIAETRFEPGATLRVPLIPHALANLECTTDQVILSGDHAIIIGIVTDARVRDGEPLLYFGRRFGKFVALGG